MRGSLWAARLGLVNRELGLVVCPSPFPELSPQGACPQTRVCVRGPLALVDRDTHPHGFVFSLLSADTEDVCIVERLFSSSLVAIVSLKAPRKLKVCHFKKGTEICNYSYSNTILAVKLNRQVGGAPLTAPGPRVSQGLWAARPFQRPWSSCRASSRPRPLCCPHSLPRARFCSLVFAQTAPFLKMPWRGLLALPIPQDGSLLL